MHHDAAQLFEYLATIDPERVRELDRREQDTQARVATIGVWITITSAHPFNLHTPAPLSR